MRLGVHLGDFRPEDGGGYTFIRDVSACLIDLAKSGSIAHELVLFCGPNAFQFLRDSAADALTVVQLEPESWLLAKLQAYRLSSPLGAFLWRRKSRFQRELDAAGVDLVWFVGASGESLNTPYIATVWDLQHRTHPWFPEVGEFSVWDRRERHFSRYLRRAAVLITGTQVGKQELEHYYQINPYQITVLPHPTPSYYLEQSNKSPLPYPAHLGLKGDYLLYPAQFWAHKNHALLLKAFSSLVERGDVELQLVFVGSDKGNKAYVVDLISRLGLSDRVRLLGFVAIDDLVALYQNAKALVYASFSGPENLPPLEAFALRCPVVQSAFPGANEQLGDAAFYFDPTESESLVRALQQLQGNAAERETLTARGYARAASWTANDFVAGVMRAIDRFAPYRAAWSGHAET
jgi:glycosyltransferase involved in cell wall biosynthesis